MSRWEELHMCAKSESVVFVQFQHWAAICMYSRIMWSRLQYVNFTLWSRLQYVWQASICRDDGLCQWAGSCSDNVWSLDSKDFFSSWFEVSEVKYKVWIPIFFVDERHLPSRFGFKDCSHVLTLSGACLFKCELCAPQKTVSDWGPGVNRGQKTFFKS